MIYTRISLMNTSIAWKLILFIYGKFVEAIGKPLTYIYIHMYIKTTNSLKQLI